MLIVAAVTAASALLLAYALAQTLAGRPRFGGQRHLSTRVTGAERSLGLPSP
jgi:hypothetical protein